MDPSQDYSEQARADAARAGHALPDGSYPQRTCREVGDAIDGYGRAPDSHRPQLAELIRQRNSDLKCGYRLEKLEDPPDDMDADSNRRRNAGR